MSWTDKKSVEVIKYLRDKYKVKIFVETGTFKGINARLHSNNFEKVLTCEINREYYKQASIKLMKGKNAFMYKIDSPRFLRAIEHKDTIIYLDAHFYDKLLPKDKRFVVLDELKALKGDKNCVVIIHDFDNGLGHITYDGQSLNLDLIKKDLFKVNPKFKLYTNELASCDIVKPNSKDIELAGLTVDKDTLDNLEYAWSSPRLTFRGILYCLPTELSPKEMKVLGLKEWK